VDGPRASLDVLEMRKSLPPVGNGTPKSSAFQPVAITVLIPFMSNINKNRIRASYFTLSHIYVVYK
jgi:hypothetical protein